MNEERELWSVRDIAAWLGLSMPAAYALVGQTDFPLPVRGQAHSRRWSRTVVRDWITTPRFAPPMPVRVPAVVVHAAEGPRPLEVSEVRPKPRRYLRVEAS